MVDLTSVIINQALKDEKNLEVAFETWRAFSSQRIYNQICENFVTNLKDRINHEINTKFNSLVKTENWDDKSNSFKINISISFKNVNWSDDFKISIADYDSSRLHFGVTFKNDNHNFCKKIYNLLQKNLNSGTYNEWNWWLNAKNPYNTWENNYESFKQFAFCDKMALDYFSDNFCQIIETIDKIMNDLHNIQ